MFSHPRIPLYELPPENPKSTYSPLVEKEKKVSLSGK
jgi:hypothetical protein